MKKIFLTLVGIAFSALPLAAFTSQSAQNAVDGVNKVAANVAAAAQVYPFTLSTAPANGQWDANTNWYTLTLRGQYLKHVANQDHISLTNDVNKNDANFLWMFVEKSSGVIEIYNKAAGAGHVLASVSPKGAANTGGNTYPIMTDKTALTGKIGAWDYSITQNNNQPTKDGSFFLDLEGANETIKMNNRQSKLAYWTNSWDDGSKFRVEQIGIIFSDAPSADSFAQNTTWYYFKMRTGNNNFTKYINYDETHKDKIGSLQMKPSEATPSTYGNLWAFVKDAQSGKIKVYNAATGPTYVLTSAKPTNDGHNTFPFMELESADKTNKTCLWTLDKTANGANTSNCFKFGVTFDNTTTFLSDWSGANSTELRFWTGEATTDQGYNCYVEKVDIAASITKNTITQEQQNAKYLGTFVDSNIYAQYAAALNKNNATGLSEALKIYSNSGNLKHTLDVNKHYRLKNRNYPTHYMTMAVNGSAISAKGMDLNQADAAQIWSFTTDANGYKLGAQSRYLKGVVQSQAIQVSEEVLEPNTDAAKYLLLTVSNLYYSFDRDGNNNRDQLHEDGSHNIVGWETSAPATQWNIIPATSIDVTIKAAGYATVNYPFAVQLPQNNANLKAYTGKVAKNGANNVFVLTEIQGGQIPANTPFVLGGNEGNYSLTILDKGTQVAAVTDNSMAGTYMEKSFATTEDTYVLAKPANKTIGFYLLNNTSTDTHKVSANKAYLPKSSIPAAAANTFGFAFSLDGNGGGTTGIEETTTDVSNEEFYDLQGRRVLNPTNGIFVTKSGKKVLFMN